MNPIQGIGTSVPVTGASSSAVRATSSAQATSFEQMLAGGIRDVAAADSTATSAIQRSLAGEDISQIEVVSSVKQADLALRMMVQVRNKLMDAYNEVRNLRM